MKQQIRRHFWLVAAGIAIGLLIVFWPRALTNPLTGFSNEKSARRNVSITLPNTNDATGSRRNVESRDVISSDVGKAEESALLHQQAMNAWQVGNIREAMSLFEQAIAAGPRNPAPHSNYGRLLTLMTAYQEALPLLQRARELTPDDAQVWLDLATLYERTQVLGKSWEAQAVATKLVGTKAITRDEKGRFVVQGNAL